MLVLRTIRDKFTARFFLSLLLAPSPHAFPHVPTKQQRFENAAIEGSRNRTQYFAVREVEVVIHLYSERLLPQTTEVDDSVFTPSVLYVIHGEYPLTSDICLQNKSIIALSGNLLEKMA